MPGNSRTEVVSEKASSVGQSQGERQDNSGSDALAESDLERVASRGSCVCHQERERTGGVQVQSSPEEGGRSLMNGAKNDGKMSR